MQRKLKGALVALAMIGAGIGAVQSAIAGPEFKANTFTAGDQRAPAMALLNNGRFVMVWRDQGPSTPPSDDEEGRVTGQIFSAAGAKVGTHFIVSSSRYDNQLYTLGYPGVAVLTNGNFVVVWSSDADDAGSGDIHGRIMTPNGTPAGAEFKVNRLRPGPQLNRVAVAALADGGFVASWASSPDGSSAASYDIYGQRFTANGTKVGPQFRVHANLEDAESEPAVAAFPAAEGASEAAAPGGFVVVWASVDDAGQPYRILVQMFSSGGTKVNSRITVAQDLGSRRPRVAVLPSGGFVVVWESWDQARYIFRVRGQRFTAEGIKEGGAFLVKSAAESQAYPDVAVLSDGGFVIVFTDDEAQDGTIYARRYDSAGVAAAAAVRVNTTLYQSYRLHTAVTGLQDGQFAVGWTGQDNGDPLAEDFEIKARVMN